jgi:hypothetical protein
VPAVSICTEPFRIPAEAMANAYGFPGFAHVLTEHPIASLTLDEVRERVALMLPRIVAILGVEE